MQLCVLLQQPMHAQVLKHLTCQTGIYIYIYQYTELTSLTTCKAQTDENQCIAHPPLSDGCILADFADHIV